MDRAGAGVGHMGDRVDRLAELSRQPCALNPTDSHGPPGYRRAGAGRRRPGGVDPGRGAIPRSTPPPPLVWIYIFPVRKRRFHHSSTLGGPLLHGVKTHMAAPLGDGPVCPSSLTNLGLPVMNRTSWAFHT